jgi:hypothetical protein
VTSPSAPPATGAQEGHIPSHEGPHHPDHEGRKPFWRSARIVLRPVIPTLVFVGAALAIFSPTRYPIPVHTYATVTPAQKWILVKGSNGQLVARTFNYQTGMSDGYRVSNFTTGSSITFTVEPSMTLGRHVSVGDTVGWISSSETQERLVVLNGQLAAAERALAVNATGQKAEIVAEAEQRLQFAKRRRDDYQATVNRTQTLYDRHLIPANDYDNVQSQAHVLDDEVSIATANLQAARTGAKPEQLALAESNITALKNEISAINSRAATYTLRSPIDGVVTPTATGDTLLTIASTSEYVALVPIGQADYPRVAALRSPALTIVGYSPPVQGRIVAINREVQTLYGQKVVMATAVLNSHAGDLLPGSIVRCRVQGAPLTALEYGKLLFASAAAGGTY